MVIVPPVCELLLFGVFTFYLFKRCVNKWYEPTISVIQIYEHSDSEDETSDSYGSNETVYSSNETVYSSDENIYNSDEK